MENMINAFTISFYRIMLNIKCMDRIPNKTTHDLTKTSPLIFRVSSHQLTFCSHPLCMPDSGLVKEYALYIPPCGRTYAHTVFAVCSNPCGKYWCDVAAKPNCFICLRLLKLEKACGHCLEELLYSWTSHKRPTKMSNLGFCLGEIRPQMVGFLSH